MARSRSRVGMFLLGVFSFVTLGTVAAQNVLRQISLSEKEARDMALSAIASGNVYFGAVGRTVQALPPASRASVVTAGIAWARAFVESPAFGPAWEEFRNRSKPAPPDVTGTVDDEYKAELDKRKAEIEETKKK